MSSEDFSFDLDSLVNLEQSLYDEGYKDGFEHGKIHGLIEGRALGREKGFEMWEELGYYEGFALVWRGFLSSGSGSGRSGERSLNHIKHLLELIDQFPRVNPSFVQSANANGNGDVGIDSDANVDIPKLFRQIRSRYKALCATLGVRPSLRASESGGIDPEEGSGNGMHVDDGDVVIASLPLKRKVGKAVLELMTSQRKM